MRMWLGQKLRLLALKVLPDYWKCTECGHTMDHEAEVICWVCGRGEMIYKGE